MRILITNDDGVNARGLRLLESVARKLSDDIWIVAPSEEQSGAGHSLTLTEPVRLRLRLPIEARWRSLVRGHGEAPDPPANGQPEEILTCHQFISMPTIPSRGRTCQFLQPGSPMSWLRTRTHL